MNDELLPYYNRELTYLRKVGEKFAQEHPKIAGRLRLGSGEAGDPHVERLIEAVAFLNGRIQHRLDDDFPEVSDALLSVLHPQYLAPIPSMSIARFTADPEATAKYVIERGSELETERIDGNPCVYRTSFETDVWPLDIEEASLTPTPFEAPPSTARRSAVACLRLSITARSGASLADLDLSTLRLHLKGLPQHVHPLYELLLNDVIGVSLARSPGDQRAIELPTTCLSAAGLAAEESVLPDCARTSPAYRMLTEFFAFSQKFLFVDLGGLEAARAHVTDRLEVYLYLGRLPRDLDRFISADNFALNCTPIVNLFERRAEPIRFEHLHYEQRVVPDARRPLAMEVHSIDRLTAVDKDGESRDLRPFYGIDHGPGGDAAPVFWHGVRRPSSVAAEKPDDGTEVYLQVVDLEFQASEMEGFALTAETTCTNRDLPGRLPFGGGHPRLALSAGGAVESVECLTAPTRTRRPALGDGARWRLISHLSLNHLSLSDEGGSVESLRELLRLYDAYGTPETQKVIDAIQELRCEPTVARIHAGGQPSYCRGLAVTLVLDETKFSGSGVFLFATVLERFLGLYASVNSFIQLTLKTNMRDGVVKQWPPRAGNRALL
ncbi:MAG: type VI secretion system protein ImpG [Planctomycetota bacterium]|jgi:type VI secretion system protein ImpG